ncbi:MAG: ankyrin repeat domain-containing protein [Terriglobia bacterium]
MPKTKRIDPIPTEFASYEEAAEFWDTHDTSDYPSAFRTAKVVMPMHTYLKFVKAAESKDAETLTRLISEHPELHTFEGDDGSLLDVIRYSCPDFLEAAFAAGLSPDSGPPAQVQTLLQHAVCDNDLELVKLCLRYGADVDRRNYQNETPLGYAASCGSLDVVRLLVEAGADVNAIEGNKKDCYSTALDSTYFSDPAYDRPEIRAFLREHGAKRYSELMSSPSS